MMSVVSNSGVRQSSRDVNGSSGSQDMSDSVYRDFKLDSNRNVECSCTVQLSTILLNYNPRDVVTFVGSANTQLPRSPATLFTLMSTYNSHVANFHRTGYSALRGIVANVQVISPGFRVTSTFIHIDVVSAR